MERVRERPLFPVECFTDTSLISFYHEMQWKVLRKRRLLSRISTWDNHSFALFRLLSFQSTSSILMMPLKSRQEIKQMEVWLVYLTQRSKSEEDEGDGWWWRSLTKRCRCFFFRFSFKLYSAGGLVSFYPTTFHMVALFLLHFQPLVLLSVSPSKEREDENILK